MKRLFLIMLPAGLLLLTSCSDPGSRLLARGKELLARGEPADARLVFAEGFDYYREQNDTTGMLTCRLYQERGGLARGSFRNELSNLERIRLDYASLKLSNRLLELQINLTLVKACLYGYETGRAAALHKESRRLLDLFLQEQEEMKLKALQRTLAEVLPEFLITAGILQLQQGNLFAPEEELARYGAYCRQPEIPRLIQEAAGATLPAPGFISRVSRLHPTREDLVWLLALKVSARAAGGEEKQTLLEEAYGYFRLRDIYCLAGYTAYYLATTAGSREGELALEYYKAALPVMERLGKEDFYMNCLAGLGILYYKRGNYALAQDYFHTVLPLYEKAADRLNMAECRNYLAVIYKAFGNLLAAEKEFLAVLDLAKELGDRSRIAAVYNNLGVIYKDQLQYEKAFDYFEAALAMVEAMLAGETYPVRVKELYAEKYIKLNNMAEILISRREYNQALDSYLEELGTEIAIRGLSGSVIDATVRMNTAACRYFLIRAEPDLSPAMCAPILKLLTEAHEIFTTLGEGVKASEIRYLQGQIHFNTRAFSEARQVYLALKEDFSASKNVSHLAGVCYSLYLTEEQLGNPEAATENLRESMENYDYYIRLIPSLEGQQQIYARYLPYFEILIERLVAAGRTEEAFNYAEMMKARILLQQMQLRRMDPLLNIPAATKNRLKELSLRESALVKEFERNWWAAGLFNNAVYLEELKSRLADIEKQREEIYRTIRVQNAHVAGISQLYAAGLDEVQAALGPGEVVVNYVFAADNFYAFLVDAGSVQAVKLNPFAFDRKNLSERIVSFRGKLQDFYSDPAAESKALYDLLVAPVFDLLTGYTHVLIIPSGELFYIPFEALQDKKSGRYLVDSYPGVITYAPSCTVYVTLKAQPARKYTLQYYGLGDPDYQGRISQLTYTGPELDEVQKLFGAAGKVYKNIYASETRVKQSDLTPYRYLHFSCHGMNYGNSRFLSFPALLLAADPGDDDDGYLRHDEVSALNIPAELVLLSACQTGLGKMVPGDGLVGLNQAFFIAGAGAVIASLWNVSDRYTMLLVTDFFRRLKSGLSAARALKDAMLAIKARQWQEYGSTHPFFWAPFVLSGKD